MSLTQSLNQLENSNLIQLASAYPELEYIFRHALIQEAAYQTLVKANRRLVHRLVGESLEQLYPDRLATPELGSLLARHFAEGGQPARALDYYLLAGRAAAERYANAEALHSFDQALAIALTLPASAAAVAELYLQRGHILELSAQDAAALQNYQEMEAWAAEHAHPSARLAAITARATIHVKPSVEQNLELGHALSQQALALARELADPAAEAKVLWNLLQYAIAAGKLDEALAFTDQALQIARAHGLREQTAQVLTDAWKVHFALGSFGQALAAVGEAQAIWRELAVPNMLADTLATTAMLSALAGRYQQALALSAEANQVSRAIGNLWNESYSLYMVDLIHFEHGDIDQALAAGEACVRLAEQAGFGEALSSGRVDLAQIYAYMGALPRAFALVRELQAASRVGAIDAGSPLPAEMLLLYLHSLSGEYAAAQAALDQSPFTRHPEALNNTFIMLHLGYAQAQVELALAAGQPQPALQAAERLIAHYRASGLRFFFVDALYLRGRVLAAAGQVAEARAALEAALAEAEAVGSRRILWLVLAGLAALADGHDHAAALALWRRAAESIAYIADHAGSAELRASFLNRPDVRQVLAQAA